MAESQKRIQSEIPILFSPAQRFLSPKKSKPTVSKFFVNFLSLIVLSSCGPALVWNIPAVDLPGVIASGDTSYLEELDPANTDLAEILRNGPGSAYLHAYLAREVGREDLFAPLLEVEWLKGDRPWRMLAGQELGRHYLDTGRFAEAEHVAAGLLRLEDLPPYRQLYIEALYWQRRDDEVLDELERFDYSSDAGLGDFSIRELELFGAVSATRLSRPGWKQLILDLFLKQEPSSLHYRVYRFLENDYHEEFTAEERAFLVAIVAVADRRYADAVPILLELLDRHPERYLTPAVAGAAYNAFRYGGYAVGGARFFETLVDRRAGLQAVFYTICESAGLLFLSINDYRKAEEYLKIALDAASDEKQRDRMRWYLLRAALSQSIDKALEVAPSIVDSYADQSYYADILNWFLTRLVELGRWRDILDFYLHAKDALDPQISARTAYLCAAAFREGMLETEDATVFASASSDSERIAEVFFAEASVGGGRYYSLLGATALGTLADMLSITESSVEGGGEPTTNDLVATGFANHGLPGYAFELLRNNPGLVSDNTLLDVARALSLAGDTYNSLRTMDILRSRPSFEQTRKAVELLYPRSFRKEIEAAAKRDGIPPYLLFALIREESYFKPDIVSRSGAVGLSQLMPATAADTARRMGIDLPPLTDPGKNISIGSYYFARMLDRFTVPSNAVFAYNAGPTRMASWKRRYPSFPEDLFLEALPIEETQNHGRKVFSSAVMYGYLYYGVLPAQVAAYYFSFAQKGSQHNESY